jgi:hypothetical protein
MRYALLRASFFVVVLLDLGVSTAIAQSDIRSERVQFERGANSAVVEGKIAGR